MKTLKNLLVVIINGLAIIFFGLMNDRLMQLFNVQSITSKVIIIIGVIVAFLPMLFKIDIFDRSTSWQKSFIIFWKRNHYKLETIKQISFLGLFPIHTEVLKSVHTLDNPSLKEVAGEIAEVISIFLPGVNQWISLVINLIREKK